MTADSAAPRIPRGVWALGFVSLAMDVSSELVHALLPVYLAVALGASMLTIGVIEGIAESTAAIVRLFSGVLSDRLGRRKTLVVLGYGLSAATKPVFALATSIGWLVGARFVDRIGKGIRGAPRDALIADLSPEAARGASFGLRQALDTVGAFLGPLLAMGLMWAFANDFRAVFWFAVPPAVLAVVLLLVGVREPARDTAGGAPGDAGSAFPRAVLDRAALRGLGAAFWWLAGFATLFTLARFSEAFLILKVQSEGLALALVPLVLVVMNIAYALAAYPAGALSDRHGRFGMLVVGMLLLIGADVVLAAASSLASAALGVTLWGLHMAFTQGIVATLVADTVPVHRRGTAYGAINLLTGIGLLLASVLAGGLWDLGGPRLAFLTGGALAAISLAGLVAFRARLQPVPGR